MITNFYGFAGNFFCLMKIFDTGLVHSKGGMTRRANSYSLEYKPFLWDYEMRCIDTVRINT